ncbi:hypothetical protein ACLB1Q_21325 [Escherichia coli]
MAISPPGLTGLCGWRWGCSEITAIGVYVQFWFPEMAQWIPALIAVALVALANLAAGICRYRRNQALVSR